MTLNKSAPVAKKVATKAATAKKRAAPSPATKRVGKPPVPAEKQLLARQAQLVKKEQDQAERRAELLLKQEQEKKERQIAREEKRKQREAEKLAERIARQEKKAAIRLARKLGRPGRPTIKKDMELEDRELLKPCTERPYTGRDVDALCKRFDLNATEFAAALGLQNRFQFAKLLRSSRVVPFDVEMLCRLYDESPSPSPWRKYGADDVFKTLYGPLIEKFDAGPEDREYGETHYAKRFTAALDRSSSTAYRWLDNPEGAGARLVIDLLLRKIMSMPQPRETLERVSALVHRVRGGDFELRAPEPIPGVPRSRRGRASGHSISKRSAAMPLPIRPITL